MLHQLPDQSQALTLVSELLHFDAVQCEIHLLL